jgi:hypothetical protein
MSGVFTSPSPSKGGEPVFLNHWDIGQRDLVLWIAITLPSGEGRVGSKSNPFIKITNHTILK